MTCCRWNRASEPPVPRVRDVILDFNADKVSSRYPKYKGGHPLKFK